MKDVKEKSNAALQPFLVWQFVLLRSGKSVRQ